MFYNSRPTCEFCGIEHKHNCDLDINDRNVTFRDILAKV